MSDDERLTFVRGCKDEVCVTYRFPVRPLIAAAAAVAARAAVPPAAAACGDATVESVVVSGGGIHDPAHVEFVENPGDTAILELSLSMKTSQPIEKAAGSQSCSDRSPKINHRPQGLIVTLEEKKQMALYPKIQSPCPYKNNLSAIMRAGDALLHVQASVFDLSGMSDNERVALITGCKDEICVSYKFQCAPRSLRRLSRRRLSSYRRPQPPVPTQPRKKW